MKYTITIIALLISTNLFSQNRFEFHAAKDSPRLIFCKNWPENQRICELRHYKERDTLIIYGVADDSTYRPVLKIGIKKNSMTGYRIIK